MEQEGKSRLKNKVLRQYLVETQTFVSSLDPEKKGKFGALKLEIKALHCRLENMALIGTVHRIFFKNQGEHICQNTIHVATRKFTVSQCSKADWPRCSIRFFLDKTGCSGHFFPLLYWRIKFRAMTHCQKLTRTFVTKKECLFSRTGDKLRM